MSSAGPDGPAVVPQLLGGPRSGVGTEAWIGGTAGPTPPGSVIAIIWGVYFLLGPVCFVFKGLLFSLREETYGAGEAGFSLRLEFEF